MSTTDVYVIGAAMTPFGRYLDKSVKQLTREAVSGALTDAGLAQREVAAAYFANTTQGVLEGQYLVPGAGTVSRQNDDTQEL